MDILQLVYESGFREGFAKGLAESIAEGRAEEKAKVLEIFKNYIQKESALKGKELTNEEAFRKAEKIYNNYEKKNCDND